jgi:hypothetical protein
MCWCLKSQEDKRGALKVVTRLLKFLGSNIDLDVASMVDNLLRQAKWEIRTPKQNEIYSNSLSASSRQVFFINDDENNKELGF